LIDKGPVAALTRTPGQTPRNEVGLDVALEALKAYLDRGQVKIDLLMKYAKKLRVAQTMRPYVEALL
jgi:hypothetical protein